MVVEQKPSGSEERPMDATTEQSRPYPHRVDGRWQLVPWATLGGVSIALAALLVRTTRATVWLARVLAVMVIVAAVLGSWQHGENYKTAPLDARYSERWETMSVGARWWDVTKGSVGHVPVPAAAALVPLGVALAMATIGLGGPVPAGTRADRRTPGWHIGRTGARRARCGCA